MPIKIIVMVKRKPGLSRDEFRHGYETSHSRIAVRLFGHLWSEYRRNYLLEGYSFGVPGVTQGPDEIGFDAVSEYVLHDEVAFQEMRRIGQENYATIKADEALWFDQARCFAVTCDTIEEDLSAVRLD